jgi:phytanoyl-CoA hydroxylase
MSAPTSAATVTRELPLVVLANQVVFPGEEALVDVICEDQVRRVASLETGCEVLLATPWTAARPIRGLADLVPLAVRARLDNCKPGARGVSATFTGLERVRLTGLDPAGGERRARCVALTGTESHASARAAERLLELLGDTAALLSPEGRALVLRLAPGASGSPVTAGGAAADVARACDVVGREFAVAVEERAALLGAETIDQRLALLAPLVARKRTWSAEVNSFVLPTRESMRQLWPLEPDGLERIARERAAGRISADEERDLVHYVEKGFVLWERLIPEKDVDALVADVRSIARHPGHFLSTDHRRGFGFRFTDESFDAYESVFDTYVNFESARRLAFHPRVLRFLELLFEAPPIAMQQLLFQRSNQHPLHQDTAYVRVQQPLHLSATWIALEDVVEGRGELVYLEGSHRIPHQIFSDGVKWFNLERDDAAAAIRYVEDESAKLRCPKKSFLAKKGDVFLWAADLVHGSAPRTRPDHETRLSCVTHYVPKTAQPLWFMFSPDRRGLEPWGERAFIASSHYELPRATGGMQSPTLKMPLPC